MYYIMFKKLSIIERHYVTASQLLIIEGINMLLLALILEKGRKLGFDSLDYKTSLLR